MFTRFHIKNFKSLKDFDIQLSPMSALVGDNGVGKSTFLQAVDFMCKSIQEDFDVILERQGLKYTDILSKYSEEKQVSFESELRVCMGSKEKNIIWSIKIGQDKKTGKTILIDESIQDVDTGEFFLSYSAGDSILLKAGKSSIVYPRLTVLSSVLKIIDLKTADKIFKCLMSLISKTKLFDVLDPKNMRISSDRLMKSSNEENLPKLLSSMNKKQKTFFNDCIGKLMGDKFDDIKIVSDSVKKETLVMVKEKEGTREISLSSNEMSYGIIRLLSIISIMCSGDKETVFAFDELENGINNVYVNPLFDILYDFVRNHGIQLIFSSQSGYFIDFVNKYDILYFYHSEDGGTKSVKLFDIPEINAKTEYMFPGEILMNLNHFELKRIIDNAR